MIDLNMVVDPRILDTYSMVKIRNWGTFFMLYCGKHHCICTSLNF